MRTLTLFAILLAATSLTAAVVQPIGATFQLLIPAAGNTAGVNGTFFRSDISIINFASHDQTVLMQWLPEPGVTAPQPVILKLGSSTGIRSADFVHDYFNQTGLGAILITAALNPDGTGIDQTGRLFASSRIWTPQPGTNGTTSQDLPAIPAAAMTTQPVVGIFSMGGADDPPSYRTNVGIVNVDPANPQTFAIVHSLQPTTVTTITLPPFTMQQVSLGNIAVGEQILIQNVTQVNRTTFWTAYGSTINNVTGDAWDELAVNGTAP